MTQTSFRPIGFLATVLVIAILLFQVIPTLAEFVFGRSGRSDGRLFVALFVLWPAVIAMVVAQLMFFYRAIANLHLFKSGITISPWWALSIAIPVLNLVFVPWIVYQIYTYSTAVGSEGPAAHPLRTIGVWYATLTGAKALQIFGGSLPGYQWEAKLIFGSVGIVIGLLATWLTWKILKRISDEQERRAAAM